MADQGFRRARARENNRELISDRAALAQSPCQTEPAKRVQKGNSLSFKGEQGNRRTGYRQFSSRGPTAAPEAMSLRFYFKQAKSPAPLTMRIPIRERNRHLGHRRSRSHGAAEEAPWEIALPQKAHSEAFSAGTVEKLPPHVEEALEQVMQVSQLLAQIRVDRNLLAAPDLAEPVVAGDKRLDPAADDLPGHALCELRLQTLKDREVPSLGHLARRKPSQHGIDVRPRQVSVGEVALPCEMLAKLAAQPDREDGYFLRILVFACLRGH
jgi:hypothetical protein